MQYAAPIKIRNHGKGHSYRDANGQKVPGVTTLIDKGWPKAALIGWAANTSAACVVDEWDRLEEMRPSERYEHVRKARFRDKDKAANNGTKVHKIAVPLSRGEDVDVPEALAGHVRSHIKFLDDYHFQPLHTELVVVNHTHGYAGRLDVIGRLYDPVTSEWLTALLDIKTSRSGVYPESLFQLTGYRYCEHYVDKDGTYHELPDLDYVGVLWLRPHDYQLVPLTVNDETFRAFLTVKANAEFAEIATEFIGEPEDEIYPPEQEQQSA